MRTSLLTAVIYTAVVTNSYAAAHSHLHAKENLPPLSVVNVSKQDWSGLYAGFILGGQSGTSSDTTAPFGYNADNDKWHYDQSGLNTGGELGYNFALRQLVFQHRVVIGPEIEFGYLDMDGSGTQPASPGGDTVGKSSSDFYTALRARIGVVVQRNLIYVTGGAMGVNYIENMVDSCSIAPCGGGTVYANANNYVWGYTVGGGIEHLFDRHWSIKLEGLYYNLDNQRFSGMTNLGNTYEWTGSSFGYLIRGGINYSF